MAEEDIAGEALLDEQSSEYPTTPEELEKLRATEQGDVLRAVEDLVVNLSTTPIGNQELRSIGRQLATTPEQDLNELLSKLGKFIRQINGAVKRVNAGKPLPKIKESDTGEMVDFKYTDYTKKEDSPE